jgi:hypothetical protein
MKKILSVVLAVTLALSLGVMSFAADTSGYDQLINFIHNDDVKAGIESILEEVGVYDEVIDFVHTDEFKAEFETLIGQAGGLLEDPSQVAGIFDDLLVELSANTGVSVDDIKDALADTGLFDLVANLYMPAAPETTTAVEETIVDTGSAVGGIAIFATLSIAAAAAFVCTKKN